MSASARKLTPIKFVVASSRLPLRCWFSLLSAKPAGRSLTPCRRPSVVAMLARVRAASPADQQPYAERPRAGTKTCLLQSATVRPDELFTALLDKWPRESAALYGAALAAFNLGRPLKPNHLLARQRKLSCRIGDKSQRKRQRRWSERKTPRRRCAGPARGCSRSARRR